jgi:hypothetical protein
MVERGLKANIANGIRNPAYSHASNEMIPGRLKDLDCGIEDIPFAGKEP